MVRIRVSMVIFFAALAAVGQGQTMDPVLLCQNSALLK